jgi:hypothetical protein
MASSTFASASGDNMPRLGEYICKRIARHNPMPVLLAIDNAHLLTKEGIPNSECLEILAGIIATGVVPVILSGRDGTSAVAGGLFNMVGQIMETVELSPLPYARGSDLEPIQNFLLIVQEELSPLLARLGISMRFGAADWAKRFWAGSWGRHGYITALVRETLLTIIRSRAETRRNSRYSVKREDFAEAWRLQIARDSPLKFNPFKREDPPTLGEIQDARAALVQKKKEEKLRLPTAPKGKGALIWR